LGTGKNQQPDHQGVAIINRAIAQKKGDSMLQEMTYVIYTDDGNLTIEIDKRTGLTMVQEHDTICAGPEKLDAIINALTVARDMLDADEAEADND